VDDLQAIKQGSCITALFWIWFHFPITTLLDPSGLGSSQRNHDRLLD